mmetsp:Transcript_41020/g.128016  ORF Transcript_41020/g.128016 Transcript_41020/m.128016 type:complete len:281 (+) Transcript_41020:176-1018(+)
MCHISHACNALPRSREKASPWASNCGGPLRRAVAPPACCPALPHALVCVLAYAAAAPASSASGAAAAAVAAASPLGAAASPLGWPAAAACWACRCFAKATRSTPSAAAASSCAISVDAPAAPPFAASAPAKALPSTGRAPPPGPRLTLRSRDTEERRRRLALRSRGPAGRLSASGGFLSQLAALALAWPAAAASFVELLPPPSVSQSAARGPSLKHATRHSSHALLVVLQSRKLRITKACGTGRRPRAHLGRSSFASSGVEMSRFSTSASSWGTTASRSC